MDKNRENPLVTYVPSKTRLFPMFIACRVFGLMSIYRVVTLFIHYMHCCGIGEGVFGCLTRCFLCENRGNTYSLVDKMAEKMLVTYVFGVLGVKNTKKQLNHGLYPCFNDPKTCSHYVPFWTKYAKTGVLPVFLILVIMGVWYEYLYMLAYG